MLDVVGPQRLIVIANTGDDIEIYGAHVSPDPDLVCYSLADLIDKRGYGVEGDTFAVVHALRRLGADVWFNLGDSDLAWCLRRTQLEAQGMRHTLALRELCRQIGLQAQVLPMCDMPQRTIVNGLSLQEFLIRDGGKAPVREVRFECERPVHPSPEVVQALRQAQTLIIGPSNPVISIWPILHALRDVIHLIEGRAVCVSPIVASRVLKGPTASCLHAHHQPATADGVIGFYESVCPSLLAGIVADEEPRSRLPHLVIDTLMGTPSERAQLAASTLAFAESLQSRAGHRAPGAGS